MIEIRPADARDVADLSALGKATFLSTYRGTAADADIHAHIERYFGKKAITEEMAKPAIAYLCLIAHEDEHCAGLLKLREGKPHECLATDSAIEVQQLYVSTEFQRRGVGAVLIEAATDVARRAAVDGLWLGVWSQADWAIAFYEAVGFERRGHADFHLGSVVHKDYVMWLPVGPLQAS